MLLLFTIIPGMIGFIIIGGQMLSAVCDLYADGCPLSQSVWIALSGALLMVLSYLPDLGRLPAVTASCLVCLLTYSAVAVVLSVIDGGGQDVSYAVGPGARWGGCLQLTLCVHGLAGPHGSELVHGLAAEGRSLCGH